jgi:hypothetical protein
MTRKATAEETFYRMRAWLQHEVGEKVTKETANRTSSAPTPTRLIDVAGASRASQKDSVRLVETKSIGQKSQELEWIALSHRWGSCQHMTTTKQTLQSHLEEISFAALPQTFQDAVIVTRKLNVRYLWIDALCIIQNDKDDWNKEGAIMGDIYKHSLCTIAAHSAVDDEGGFLKSTLADLFTIRLSCSNTDEQLEDQVFFVSPALDFISDANRSQLSRRAWVLQERLLPERIVHFTTSQIYWESTSALGARAENGAMVSDEHIASRPAIPRLHQPTGETPLMWFDIVERYTACGLTKPEDKLIAISGLAKHFQQCTEVGYLAGIWADRLHTGLLWAAKKRMQQVGTARASTWSWAALEGPVAFPISIARHEYGRQRPQIASEVSILTAVYDGPAQEQEPVWLNGPGSLILNACLKACMLSAKATNGRISQRVPFIMHAGGSESDEQPRGRLEPYADVARRLGMGTLYGSNEELETLHSHGCRIISVIEDPQLNEETLVRNIVDESGNAVGWAALDEEDGEQFIPSELAARLPFEVFQMHSCMKVASYTDQLGINGTFVLIAKPRPQGRPGEWVRIGMGLVRGDVYFEGVSSRLIFLY